MRTTIPSTTRPRAVREAGRLGWAVSRQFSACPAPSAPRKVLWCCIAHAPGNAHGWTKKPSLPRRRSTSPRSGHLKVRAPRQRGRREDRPRTPSTSMAPRSFTRTSCLLRETPCPGVRGRSSQSCATGRSSEAAARSSPSSSKSEARACCLDVRRGLGRAVGSATLSRLLLAPERACLLLWLHGNNVPTQLDITAAHRADCRGVGSGRLG